MYDVLKQLAVWIIALLLSGCASVPSPQQRQDTASQLAANHHWQARVIQTRQFDLLSYRPKNSMHETELTMYIEGDGLAWLNSHTISTDPTPINPVGLKLALNHPKGNAVYLARPCQYMGGITARNCNKHDWSNRRFSEEVIRSTNDAVNSLKAEFNATKLQLIGFSGGGAVATLLAARRDDVTKLITVAGNLDHQAWTSYHKISPLRGSLNPADYRQKLTKLNQIHFVGHNDKIMPPFLARHFVAGLPNSAHAKVIVKPNQSHGCCWEFIWTELMIKHSN
jgi:hypothetical protein